MKEKIAKDVRILIAEGVTLCVLLALTILLKPSPDFTRGLFAGFGAVAIAVVAIVAVRRFRGGRRFGERDEREAALEGKAAAIAVFATVIGLALFVILAASIPAVRSVSSTALAVVTVLGTTAVYRIGALLFKRLS